MGLDLEKFDADVTAYNQELRANRKAEKPLRDEDDPLGMVDYLVAHTELVKANRMALKRPANAPHDLVDK